MPRYTISDNDVKRVTTTAASVSDALRKFGLPVKGTTHFAMLRTRMKSLGLSYDDLAKRGRENARGLLRPAMSTLTITEVLREHSPFGRLTAKRLINRNKLLPNHCQICSAPPTWNGKPLTLRLDHINGVSDDHRLENLRNVCPNCDSQLITFGARRFKAK
jgi:hypothetical protein